MLNSKALQLMRVLSRPELERLRRFAKSSYCNTNQNALDLLEKLVPHYPHFAGPLLKKRPFYQSIFPGKAYNDAYFRKQLSGLYQMIRSFLSFEEWNQNKELQQIYLLRQLRQRKLENVFQIHFDQAVEDLNAEAVRSTHYFNQAFQLAEEASFLKTEEKDNKVYTAQLQHLDILYLIKRLKVICDMLSQQGEDNNSLSPYLQALLEKEGNAYTRIPTLAIHWLLYKAWSEPDEPSFYYQFTEKLAEHLAVFPHTEQQWFYEHAEQYCWLQLRAGFREFIDQLFLVQKIKLEKGLFLIDNQLPPQQFQDLVTLGLQLQKLAWVRRFITDYHELLPPADREDLLIYQNARVDQAAGELEKAADALTAHNFKLSELATKAALLHFQLLYQTEQNNQLIEELDNWRLRWMRSPELSTAERQSLLNCISVLKQIIRIQKQSKLKAAAELMQKKTKLNDRIENLHPIAHERWLKQILVEI